MFTLLKRFNRLLRSSSNSHRGYTLIELVVVMSMSSILVLAAVRFVSDISTLSRTHRLEQESYRDGTMAMSALEKIIVDNGAYIVRNPLDVPAGVCYGFSSNSSQGCDWKIGFAVPQGPSKTETIFHVFLSDCSFGGMTGGKILHYTDGISDIPLTGCLKDSNNISSSHSVLPGDANIDERYVRYIVKIGGYIYNIPLLTRS